MLISLILLYLYNHWLVRMEWHPAGWSVCLPLLIFPCTIKSRSSLLAPAHPGGTGKRVVKLLWLSDRTNCYVIRKEFTESLYIKEYRTPLSPRWPLIGLLRDFTREHGSSQAWKWSTTDVDCCFLIRVTLQNSVTLTLKQQRRRPADQPPPPAAAAV